MLYKSILETIGKTPIVDLRNLGIPNKSKIYAKVESFNPGSSIKDRAALSMIETAESDGLIQAGFEIVEATSGNTGIGLAMVTAAKGYDLTIFMPESVSIERQKIMKAYGAKVYLTPAQDGMQGAVTSAEKYVSMNDQIFLTKQFVNEANPEAHRKTTALEIIEDLGSQIDVFISCVGTGGTITGIGEVLKSKIPSLKIIAVEPDTSPVISGGKPGKHDLEGMGAGFIPEVLNTAIIDEVVGISKEEAYRYARLLATNEGIFCGKSSGASLAAAFKYLEKNPDSLNILIILPDTGERYLTTDLWE